MKSFLGNFYIFGDFLLVTLAHFLRNPTYTLKFSIRPLETVHLSGERMRKSAFERRIRKAEREKKRKKERERSKDRDRKTER